MDAVRHASRAERPARATRVISRSREKNCSLCAGISCEMKVTDIHRHAARRPAAARQRESQRRGRGILASHDARLTRRERREVSSRAREGVSANAAF